MKRITQEAHKHQGIVKPAKRQGQKYAIQKNGASLSSVKHWRKRYDGTWLPMRASVRPLSVYDSGGGTLSQDVTDGLE